MARAAARALGRAVLRGGNFRARTCLRTPGLPGNRRGPAAKPGGQALCIGNASCPT